MPNRAEVQEVLDLLDRGLHLDFDELQLAVADGYPESGLLALAA